MASKLTDEQKAERKRLAQEAKIRNLYRGEPVPGSKVLYNREIGKYVTPTGRTYTPESYMKIKETGRRVSATAKRDPVTKRFVSKNGKKAVKAKRTYKKREDGPLPHLRYEVAPQRSVPVYAEVPVEEEEEEVVAPRLSPRQAARLSPRQAAVQGGRLSPRQAGRMSPRRLDFSDV